MDERRIVDNVCEVLTREDLLTARQICARLAQRGINLPKESLNSILFRPRNRRPGLRRNNQFLWSYEPSTRGPTEEAPKLPLWSNEELAAHRAWIERHNQESAPVEFVQREDGLRFIMLGPHDGRIRVVGPHGNVLVDDADNYSEPHTAAASDFPEKQLDGARREQERLEFAAEKAQRWKRVRELVDTELRLDHAFVGPPVRRLHELHSVDAAANVRHLSLKAGDSQRFTFVPAEVEAPLFLFVDRVATDGSRERHGTFCLSLYELIKQKVAEPDQFTFGIEVREDDDEVTLRGSKYYFDLEGP